MKKGFIIKLVLGLLLITALILIGYKLLDTLAGFIVDAISGAEFPMEDYSDELYTPEPLPTMPGYMFDDSFYDDAGSVIFGDE